MKHQHKKLCIIGKGRNYNEARNATHHEKWCVATAYPLLDFAVDKVIECHESDVWKALPWLSNIDKPVILLNEDKMDFFEEKEYINKEYLIKEYGNIFSSSVAWILIHAIEQGYNEIDLFGIDMAHRSEYGEQRDGTFFVLGLAYAKRIKINIQKGSGLDTLNTLYGANNENNI